MHQPEPIIFVSELNRNSNDAQLIRTTLPSFYLLNATSLAKPNAKQHLFADIQNTKSDIVLVVET
jgi:hypothetical protein